MGQYVYQFRYAGDDGIGRRPPIAECPLATTYRRLDPSAASIVPESRPAAIGRES